MKKTNVYSALMNEYRAYLVAVCVASVYKSQAQESPKLETSVRAKQIQIMTF